LIGKHYLYSHLSHSFDGQTLMVWTEEQQEQVNQFIESGRIGRWHPIELTTPLLGHHQVENAATAFAALQAVNAQGLNITLAAIKRGFLNVDWPCRFEVLRRKPPVILDSAHNRDSALKLRLALDDYLGGLPVILVFGASEDKDVQGIFAELLPRVRQLVADESTHPRAMAANKLVELAHRFGCAARAVQRVEVAFKESLREAGQDAAVVVAGSLFVSAAARQTWFEMEEIQRTT
jgi:dihydrofolate synthase/folylpolyglutamate synthase